MNTSTTNHQALWLRFKQGDTAALEYFFKTYQPVLFRYGMSITQDEQYVQDCIQDLFMTLWQSRSSLAEVVSVNYYLIVALRRLILKAKSRQYSSAVEITDQIIEILPSQIGYDEQLIHNQEKEQQQYMLAKAIDNLPLRQREALQLKYLKEKSYAEITELMNINYQTARKFVYHGLRKLRKQMVSFIL